MNGDEGKQQPGQPGLQSGVVNPAPSVQTPQTNVAAPQPGATVPAAVSSPPSPPMQLPNQAVPVANASDAQTSAENATQSQASGFYHAEPTASTANAPLAGGTLRTDTNDDPTAIRPVSLQPEGSQPVGVSWSVGGEAIRGHLSGWQARMIFLSVLLGVVIFFLTSGDLISSGSVVFVAILFSLLGSRRTHEVSYRIDNSGVLIGPKLYAFNEFRAFTMFQDRSLGSVELIPLKRFMPVVLLRLDRVHDEQVLAALSQYLPMEQHRKDIMDHIVDRIKI